MGPTTNPEPTVDHLSAICCGTRRHIAAHDGTRHLALFAPVGDHNDVVRRPTVTWPETEATCRSDASRARLLTSCPGVTVEAVHWPLRRTRPAWTTPLLLSPTVYQLAHD